MASSACCGSSTGARSPTAATPTYALPIVAFTFQICMTWIVIHFYTPFPWSECGTDIGESAVTFRKSPDRGKHYCAAIQVCLKTSRRPSLWSSALDNMLVSMLGTEADGEARRQAVSALLRSTAIHRRGVNIQETHLPVPVLTSQEYHVQTLLPRCKIA